MVVWLHVRRNILHGKRNSHLLSHRCYHSIKNFKGKELKKQISTVDCYATIAQLWVGGQSWSLAEGGEAVSSTCLHEAAAGPQLC